MDDAGLVRRRERAADLPQQTAGLDDFDRENRRLLALIGKLELEANKR